ncbi:RagB/SusD family nutrient uptake outer membrane protein [Parapedobacter koreensis]|uniref:SusD family protein n=1 Tax=Parapedobacter koreensis TaxID=332977 RepID=A0A1H7GTD8_9SPHI|nr:RagB/SusD family nutrient uptake outer membrane protein [Parapedobacter koreensis]SEK41289.1 SusD family protein [Parapedobacter koreensis]
MKRLINVCVLVSLMACGETFLDRKPALNQRVPGTVSDYLGLMDAKDMMNANSSHILGFIGSDEYYMADAEYDVFPVGGDHDYQRNAYTWERMVYQGTELPQAIDWDRGYSRILWANLVLEGLDGITPTQTEMPDWRLARGMALFFRALNHFTLAQLYAPVYGENADALPGIPLRRETDVKEQLSRATLADTYAFILDDLAAAGELLPDLPLVPYKYRPSRWAVHALRIRIYMQLGDYSEANAAAERCLAIKSDLIDFNTLDLTQTNPFPIYSEDNPEVILNTTLDNGVTLTRLYYHPDTVLLDSYEEGDLRRQAYFDGTGDMFSGSYDGSALYFTGLATDEVYLNKAECEARLGNAATAVDLLNELRKRRFQTGKYTPYGTDNPAQALHLVLEERRKELVMRGIRWGDLKRLNKEEEHATTLRRRLGDREYTLPPNDARYVWPIPPAAVQQGGYGQNER